MSFRITSNQRSNIKRLLSAADYDARTVTFMHRRLGVPDALIGRAVDEWLDTLDLPTASKLIDKLKEEADEGDDDEA